MIKSAQAFGHFGELLQGRLGRNGPVALITLPCPALAVSARAYAGTGLQMHGAGQRLLQPERARKFLQSLGVSVQGRVALCAQMPAGGGAGASTAGLVALARLAGWHGAPEVLAQACLAAEGATDPLMFARAETRLWASRQAQTLAHLPDLPPFEVIGGFFGAGHRTDPKDCDFPDISDLLPQWAAAAAASDLPALAALCSTSARRCLEWRGPAAQMDPTASLATGLGALGYVIAHTGAARGLIFARGTVPHTAKAALRGAGLLGIVTFRAGGLP